MFKWLRDYKAYKARIDGEARLLIVTMGDEAAWQHAFRNVRKLSATKIDNRFECHVLRAIEKKIGRRRGPDTATRMLENSQRKQRDLQQD